MYTRSCCAKKAGNSVEGLYAVHSRIPEFDMKIGLFFFCLFYIRGSIAVLKT